MHDGHVNIISHKNLKPNTKMGGFRWHDVHTEFKEKWSICVYIIIFIIIGGVGLSP
jgi:hypothetical protein